MEHELKYDVKICINDMIFVDDSHANEFHENFDEVYNVFMVKLGDLLDEYGVKRIDAILAPNYLLNR